MSLYKGSTLIAGGRQCMPLLSFMWADHQLNDISWLRADTFSWQSGTVYQAAYQHLTNDMPTAVPTITLQDSNVYVRDTDGDVAGANHPYCWKSGTYKAYTNSETPSVGDWTYGNQTTYLENYQITATGTNMPSPETETIAGTTISYYVAADGHKIVLADQESNVAAIYEATGVAWYYILDTANQRFKLPRTKFGFSGLRNTVGGYVAPGLPNITGNTHWIGAVLNNNNTSYANGVFSAFDSNNGAYAGGGGYGNAAGRLSFDASRSSSIYGNSSTVQPPATQMYLYFYVGSFKQTALENTAGLNADLFNGKADLSTVAHVVTAFQEPTSANNYTWYRKYADGWIEQGGMVDYGSLAGGSVRSSNVTLPVVMKDTHYQVLAGYKDADSDADYALNCGYNPNQFTTAGFRLTTWTTDTGMKYRYVFWQVSGMTA